MIWLAVIGALILAVVICAIVEREQLEQWDTYAVCPGCDFHHRAPFGDKFHIHFEVCPFCGTHKRNMRVRTRRFYRGEWEDFEDLEKVAKALMGEES